MNRHESLFRSSGHRQNMLNGNFDEVGIGLVPGQFFSEGTNWNALMATQNFGRTSSTPGPLLLGVVYDDTNSNGAYDAGEGVEGVDVHPIGGDYHAVTSASGGFAVPYVGTGEVEVVFSDGPLEFPEQVSIVGTGQNVKIDLVLEHHKAKQDFDFDGRTDLFWRHASNGRSVVWFMDGVQRTGAGDLITVSDPDWTIAGFGDFDGDGRSDILWRSISTGRNVIWLMDGLTRTGAADTIPPEQPGPGIGGAGGLRR
ncbi:MAG: FG-GAP-like repeat-containing protein [Gammaproteobacteria bacterium]|nr:FG-GAP-like repeat-containing protein [Gammaproteobacteria bacterium]